jgi:hypothetical protein
MSNKYGVVFTNEIYKSNGREKITTALKMEALDYSGSLISIYKTTRYQIIEDCIFIFIPLKKIIDSSPIRGTNIVQLFFPPCGAAAQIGPRLSPNSGFCVTYN